MRRRFSFALLLVLDVGIRQPIAGPGSAGRAPRSAIRRPPDVARGPCLSGHSAVIQTPEIAARRPRPAGAVADGLGHVSDKQYISISYRP
jgi:hypothetical protein